MFFCDYADKAIKRQGLNGYNNLARVICISKPSMSALKTGKSTPSDDTMLKIAELAGCPPEEALIDLNLWRCKNYPDRYNVWQSISEIVINFRDTMRVDKKN